jgi:hypothetical protein
MVHERLQKAQERMRGRLPAKTEVFVGPVTAGFLTVQQIATERQLSEKTVIRKCRNLPGVEDWGCERTPTEADPRTYVSNLRIPRGALEHFKIN